MLGLLQRCSAADRAWSGRVHGLGGGGLLDYAVAVWGMAFGSLGVPVTCLCVAALWGRPALLRAVLATLLTFAASQPLKYVFGRERPHPRALGARRLNLRKLESNPSFPSGDSAQSAALAVVVGHATGYPWASLLAMVPLTMFARVYFGVHWIGDTIAGAALGFAQGHLALIAAATWLQFQVSSSSAAGE